MLDGPLKALFLEGASTKESEFLPATFPMPLSDMPTMLQVKALPWDPGNSGFEFSENWA